MGSTRIKGTKLMLTLGAPGEDYWADLTQYLITNEEADSDVTTFEDAADGGGRQYLLNGTAIQSTATASFWSFVWANTGQEVAFTVAPHGNETPSAEQPHFTGNVTIGPKPDLGGEAGSAPFTFEFSWKMTGEPVKDDGTAG